MRLCCRPKPAHPVTAQERGHLRHQSGHGSVVRQEDGGVLGDTIGQQVEAWGKDRRLGDGEGWARACRGKQAVPCMQRHLCACAVSSRPCVLSHVSPSISVAMSETSGRPARASAALGHCIEGGRGVEVEAGVERCARPHEG